MDPITDTVIALLRTSVGEIGGLITPATTLGELDVDSLVRVELSVGLQSRFGVDVALEDVGDDCAVADIARLVGLALRAA